MFVPPSLPLPQQSFLRLTLHVRRGKVDAMIIFRSIPRFIQITHSFQVIILYNPTVSITDWVIHTAGIDRWKHIRKKKEEKTDYHEKKMV